MTLAVIRVKVVINYVEYPKILHVLCKDKSRSLCGQDVSRETLIFEVITFTNLVSRETLCLRRVGFNLTHFPSEAQLIDFQVIQRV